MGKSVATTSGEVKWYCAVHALRRLTVTPIDNEIVDWSYINHYVCNGAVILCAFDHPRDGAARVTMGFVAAAIGLRHTQIV